MFQRILVANRGEIALRVIRACKELGVEVVAVYSQADRDAPYLELADRAICIGKAASADSYLNIPRLIAAAEVADVQAIHPGYGFLSENPHFAEICRSCNFEFIGPPHEAIRKMGLKTEAKRIAAAAKVPCVPGSEGAVASDAEAAAARPRDRLPRPHQGRGRRRRQGDARLPRRGRRSAGALQAARNEAEAAFKNPSVYLEKFIDRPRHVEVQILGRHPRQRRSTAGTATARSSAGTRSSSRKRPPPTCPTRSAAKLGEAAVRLAKTVGYDNAGTCEFLVDADNNFYFIEVNARIQVEHPVTEMVTGIDLVKQQIRIAAGEPLPHPPGGHRLQTATPSSAASTPRTPTTTSAPRPAGSPASASPAAPASAGIRTSRPATRSRPTTTR